MLEGASLSLSGVSRNSGMGHSKNGLSSVAHA